MGFSLRHLSYAVTVADLGSLSNAANQLGISQPALSSAVKGLEEGFNLDIFIRQPAKRLTLTQAGKVFISHARVLLERAEEFEAVGLGLSYELHGDLNVGCFFSTAPLIMPLIMTFFAEHHPRINIRLHEGDLQNINEWLLAGDIEVALTFDMQPAPAIAFEPLLDAPVYVLLAKSHPLAERTSIRISDLRDMEMIAMDPFRSPNHFYRSLFLSQGIKPRVARYVKSYEMVRSLVGAGMGYSMLITRPLNDISYIGSELAYIPLSDNIPSTSFGISTNANRRQQQSANTFCDICRTIIRDENKAEPYLVRNLAQ